MQPMRWVSTLVTLVWLLLACRPRALRGAQPTPQVASPPSSERDASVEAFMVPPTRSPSRVAVTPQEAESHGLAAMGFAIDDVPRSLIVTRFPGAGVLAVLSGPPGGPLGILVESDGLSGGDAVTLREALRTVALPRIGAERVLGDVVAQNLGGVSRSAVSLLAGVHYARTHYCVVVIPAMEGAGRGLLVWFYGSGYGVTTPSCDTVMQHPVLAAVATRFEVLGPPTVPR